ncbi:MAG TPA: hypothetical protein VF792_04755 [Ktedonobacterales bacterium]
MLSDVLWLVVVWIVWIAVAAVVATLVRWSMRGQQEIVTENEAEINAARSAAMSDEAEAARWSLSSAKMTGPTISAT